MKGSSYTNHCYSSCFGASRNGNRKTSERSTFIWKIADLLRGDYKQSEYGDVILPFTVLCRLDSVLKSTHEAVLAENKRIHYKNKEPFLTNISKQKFYNVSEFIFAALIDDAALVRDNLIDYIKGFSRNARSILESFDIYAQIDRLDKANLLYLVVKKFVEEIDLSPETVSNNEMGYIFEDLIHRFSEMSNETAGEHFTPREVIRLMVSILFDPDMEKICEPAFMAKLYDKRIPFLIQSHKAVRSPKPVDIQAFGDFLFELVAA